MKVQKRNHDNEMGLLVDFNRDTIVHAIEGAMRETIIGVDSNISNDIANKVDLIFKNRDVVTVEEIQDKIESFLMESSRHDVAKKYILYRDNKLKNKKPSNHDGLLTDAFISRYKHSPSPMKQLGDIVYYRTYSRFLSSESRREYWWETVRRAVEYNCSIIPTSKNEAEELFDSIYNLRQFLSGRTFWVGNTVVSKNYPMSNYNCAFQIIDNFEAFEELFYLSMLGCGVGLRVLKEDVAKLPKIRTDIDVIHKDYTPVPKYARDDNTSIKFDRDMATIIVGDSKEGWMQALRHFFRIAYSNEYRNIAFIVVNYDLVRPLGEKLKQFGGTASGHESLERMFLKIDTVLKKAGALADKTKVNLRPIDCLDIANIIGENVVSGGVRRTAEIVLIDSNSDECIDAKTNLYKEVNGKWIIDKAISHRQLSNNSIFYNSKPTRDRLHWQFEKMRYSGEPAWINGEAIRKRNKDRKGVNPCFTGNMRLLTSEGYKTFKELSGRSIEIINKDNNKTTGRVWSNGIKDIYEISFFNRDSITCTKDHRFMTIDNEEVEAANLKGFRLMPHLEPNIPDELYSKLGFIQGDGNLTRLNSTTHKGLEINFGENDLDVVNHFRVEDFEGRKWYTSDFTDELKNLGFDASILPERGLPITFNSWTLADQLFFMNGLFSANGSVISSGKTSKVSLKTTSEKLVKEIYDFFKGIGLSPTVCAEGEKEIEWHNGSYVSKPSFSLNLNQYTDKLYFYSNIGFIHNYKMNKLHDILIAHSPIVKNVKFTGRQEEVFDFNEPETHWGIVEGVVAHNCGEILLDDKGMCNLTTVNVFSFVKDGILDVEALYKAQRLSVRAGYRMTCVEMELPKWNETLQRDKLVGCSLTGWQDMVNATSMTKEQQIHILKKLKEIAHIEGSSYAKEIGQNEPILYTTVKPEGSLSQLPTVSSGVHFSHSPYYVRRIRISPADPIVKVCEELEYPVLTDNDGTKVIEFPVKAPEGRTKYDVSALKQLEIYRMFMDNYVDHNCSITVHVREHEWAEVEQWVWDHWDEQIGLTFLSLDESFYNLMPYEAITKESYEKRVIEMKPFIPSLISKYEVEEEEFELEPECTSGVCPVR